MRLCVGTSGFSYDAWRGTFYPEDIPADLMLAYYAERFDTVEINNTFYRTPKKSVVEGWAAGVPEGFRFVLKASRRVTHVKRLKDVGEETGYVLDAFAAMGERLGAILVQLPPNLRKDVARLDAFLAQVPARFRLAFEFRNPTWHDAEVAERLRAHGAALVAADVDDETEAEIVPTAGWGYLRLRRVDYPPEALARWVERVRAQPWNEVFAFFKHEEAGTGPRLAAEFARAFAAPRPAP